MPPDPFLIQEAGGDIHDRIVKDGAYSIDGDIVAAPSYRKHPRRHWAKFRTNRSLFYACALIFLLLGGRLYYLQIVRGAEYYGAAEDNRIREAVLPAPRGVIFDSTGARLAYNVPDFALYVTPADLPPTQDEEDAIFSEISRIVGQSAFDLVETFAHLPRSTAMPVEIMRGLTQEQAIVLQSKADNWPGLSVKAIEQRAYAPAEPLAHVLGYTGKISEAEYPQFRDQGYTLAEHVGKTGIEKFYETRLRGVPGKELVEINSLGKGKQVVSEQAPVAGSNLYLRLNLGLQTVAWQELAQVVKKMNIPGGSVVAMDPRDGGILAFVSLPGYDNNLFARGIDAPSYQKLLDDKTKPLYNRTALGEYPSGSTFKIIVAAGALEEKLIDPNFTVLSTGGLNVNGYRFPDWKAGGHGRTDIIKALAESVNTFFYTIGGGYGDVPGLGLQKITDYARLFGLTEPTGIDLPAENAGFLPTEEWKLKTKGERWFLGDTYHLAIGQGDILVTPLQVANYTAVIANGGTLYRPRFLEKTVSPDGVATWAKPEIIRDHFLSGATIATVKAGLRATVTAGSARSLSTLAVPLAGKTGTAESVAGVKPHAWFTGFGPYDNPEIVITVMVEAGEGGNISATPIAKKMFEWYFSHQRG